MQPTQPTTTSSEPIRGTIIIDAPTLKHLTVPVKSNADTTTASNATYLDTLVFLANHGYRILIPEVASILSASILASGDDLSSYFPSTPHKHATQPLAKFLQQVGRAHIPNIEIVSNTGPEAVDSFCNKLHDATMIESRNGRRRDTEKPKGVQSYAMIARIRREANTELFCDHAIMQMLETNSEQPTYVLSDRRQLREQVDAWAYHNQAPVRELNAARFLASLAAANLNQHINLKPTRDSSALVFGFWNDSGHTEPYERANWFDTIGRSAFSQSLKGLAAELEANAQPHPAASPPAAQQPSAHAERFAQKFGGHLKGLTTRKIGSGAAPDGNTKSDISR